MVRSRHASLRVAGARGFRGRFTLPGDKSLSHRLAILGALAEGETRIENFSTAADCASTLACLSGLGVEIERQGARVSIRGRGPDAFREPAGALDAGNSGSTLRMLAGVLAGRPFRSVLTGDDSLRKRPVERVAAPLRAMGATALTSDGRPPLTILGGRLSGIDWALPVASAQVKTAVLLAGLQAEGTTTVLEPSSSRDHTERLLPAFGVPVDRDGLKVTVRGGTPLRSVEMAVPGDASSAAFLVVAALVLPGSEARIDGVLLNPRRTAFLDVLREMGGQIETGLVEREPEPVGWIAARSSRLHGTKVPPDLVPSLIDEIPALCVAGALAEGVFAISGAAELRVKESDRIAAMAEGLGRLGAEVEERPDGLEIRGGRPLRAATLRTQGDHRIAMALSVAALAAEGETEIEGAECAAVSFPEFYEFLARGLRGPERIVLVGFMGSGKTTVGRELARLLGWEFRDLDRSIEERAGLTIAEIFRGRGEAFFREQERRTALEVSGLTRCVVAAGGGAFSLPATRETLRRGAVTVWLRCDLPTLLARIPADGSRPLAGNRETMGLLLAEREPFYRLADLVVDASGAAPEVAHRIMGAVLAGGGRRTE